MSACTLGLSVSAAICPAARRRASAAAFGPQQSLYRRPELQGQGRLRAGFLFAFDLVEINVALGLTGTAACLSPGTEPLILSFVTGSDAEFSAQAETFSV